MSNPGNSLNSVEHIYIGFIGNTPLCILASILLKLDCVEKVRILQKSTTYSIDSCCSKKKNAIFYFTGVWDFDLMFFPSNETLRITEGRRKKVWIIRVSMLFFIWKKNSVSPEERIRQDWEKEETMKCWSLWWVQIYPVYVYNWLRKKKNVKLWLLELLKKSNACVFAKYLGNPPNLRSGKLFKINVE